MRRVLLAAVLIACGACRPAGSYLFLWAGDANYKASDFLAVLDADPASARYGQILASLATGVAGTHPHHTEDVMPADGHLLANGFHAGRTWVFDLSQPLEPRIVTSFGDLAGYSHPHSFVRLADGNLLATFQYQADAAGSPAGRGAMVMTPGAHHATGGLVELDERGTVIRSGSATDTAITDRRIYPYSVLPIPALNRAVSTTTDMDEADTAATSEWVQFWRLSDLTLIGRVALKPGPRGDENRFTGEARLLPDGKSVYIHTFNCGLYLVRDIDGPIQTSALVKTFDGKECGVPVLTSHYWLQTVPDIHSLVVLDLVDPEHPREVSRVRFGEDERPHWLAIDPTGRRLVVNSGGYAKGNRLFLVNFDPSSGQVALDQAFRDPGSATPGIDLTGKTWPHGFTGRIAPHGTVFSK